MERTNGHETFLSNDSFFIEEFNTWWEIQIYKQIIVKEVKI